MKKVHNNYSGVISDMTRDVRWQIRYGEKLGSRNKMITCFKAILVKIFS